MKNTSHLAEYGTVTFDLPVMRQLIRIDPVDPSTIRAGEWIRMVPKHLRDHAYYACSAVLDKVRNTRLDAQRLSDAIIPQMQAAVFESVEMSAQYEERLNREVAEWYQKPPPCDLDDLGEVVDQMHQYLEGGREHLAEPLLRRVIQHHKQYRNDQR